MEDRLKETFLHADRSWYAAYRWQVDKIAFIWFVNIYCEQRTFADEIEKSHFHCLIADERV